MSERPNYQVYDPQMADRVVPARERLYPNPFMAGEMMQPRYDSLELVVPGEETQPFRQKRSLFERLKGVIGK
jgi:hypothetical protein